MATSISLITQVGPLPLPATFNSEIEGDVLFFVSGSAWSQTAGSVLSILLILDGTVIGSISGFTNESASHKTLVPAFIAAQLTYGPHTIVLEADPATTTVSDLNDNFHVSLIY
jgi:hypothetical protein